MRRNLGLALRQMRLLRGIKQTHFAQLMGVNQATVSRWERGQLALSAAQQAMAHRLLAAACDSTQDAALKRLVESSTRKVHLVCDRTHRLLAASPSRQAEWRADAAEFMGRSLIGYASREILEAEATLEGLGWHAAEFLKTIETEIIPLVEREYRADPSFRVLSGASLGGLFTLYAMYTKPALFNGYIAATPAVGAGNDWLFGYEEQFAKSGQALPVRLYATAGGNEEPRFLGNILRFNAQLQSRRYPGLAYEFRLIDGERHAGMQFESYVRGLRFVFAPRAPESGPALQF